jgi:hypothetical protein
MKRTLALAILGATLTIGVQPAQAGIQTFSSNTTWHVFTGVPPNGPLGNAQAVCLQATPPPSPANCPAGALDYTFGAGWTAPLTSIPHAFWIWEPGATATKSPAELAQFFFTKRIWIPGDPGFARISIAADDFAAVRVNGKLAGHIGSTTNGALATVAQNSLTTFVITKYLHEGRNRITVRAQNGIGAFSGCGPCTYQEQPAGVVFDVKIRFREDDDD